jgi:hypothetical protein
MWRTHPVKCPEIAGKSEFTGSGGKPKWLEAKDKDDYV